MQGALRAGTGGKTLFVLSVALNPMKPPLAWKLCVQVWLGLRWALVPACGIWHCVR